ncbi:DNA mismatch repair protein [Ruminococcus sp.]|uniref:MutS-related protein n=1 Tax=Ruminococcus sp. TaxID=41978 RepID=UPI0025D3BF5D|nr:DNA mismatch repair protein [Ruminococcus sp.]MCR4639309.1 DNA mismatch repair protein [Ruminococcus sp.]
MDQHTGFSLMQPAGTNAEYRRLSDHVMHDLGLEAFCQAVSSDAKESRFITNVLSQITDDAKVSEYRRQIFGDILRLPELRSTMLELFGKIQFMKDFSTMHKTTDEELGLWHLFHRLDELDSYIRTVETMRECLSDERIRSEGLTSLRDYITELYDEACFAEMKKDIAALKMKASDVQSVTLGVNVNERFEAVSIGLVSVNKKPFKKSGIVSNFADAIAARDKLRDTADWDGDMHYQFIDKEKTSDVSAFIEKLGGLSAVRNMPFVDGHIRSTVLNTINDGAAANSTFYLETVMNKMLSSLVKKLRDTLTKYANVAIVNVSGLVPEFIYYIRCAEFIGGLMEKGCVFCEAQPAADDETSMTARGFYNLKLAMNMEDVSEIVSNDLIFDKNHTVYILTGANRGGKTTITQAVGQLFVLAQGGLFVPAESFRYVPCDCIYTHFPADEDKTMDLGRLGEECVRFKEIFSQATSRSLLLLNETFSTTSFEEGYYIARDSVKALLTKAVRTIYNTHMHKLGGDAEELSRESSGAGAASLIMRTENGKRSFKVALAQPEGSSYAKDIAEKYGVTYDMLVSGS